MKKSWRWTWLSLCSMWLGLHAVLHLLLFPFLGYTVICSLMMPFSLWILTSLTTSSRIYLLLHLPPLLYCAAWWLVNPSAGLMFSLQWVPCVLMCGDILRSHPFNSLRLRIFLYVVAMLPFAAMVPILLTALRVTH